MLEHVPYSKMYLPQNPIPQPGQSLHENPADTPQNHSTQTTFHICPTHVQQHPFSPIPQIQTIYFCTLHQDKNIQQCRHTWTDVC